MITVFHRANPFMCAAFELKDDTLTVELYRDHKFCDRKEWLNWSEQDTPHRRRWIRVLTNDGLQFLEQTPTPCGFLDPIPWVRILSAV